MRARVLVLDFVIPAKAGVQGFSLHSLDAALWRGFAHLGGGRVTSLCFAKEK